MASNIKYARNVANTPASEKSRRNWKSASQMAVPAVLSTSGPSSWTAWGLGAACGNYTSIGIPPSMVIQGGVTFATLTQKHHCTEAAEKVPLNYRITCILCLANIIATC